MDKNSILKLMRSAECKCPAEIKNYAQACIELDVIKMIDSQMTVNMKSVTEITDYIIQGNDPEIVSYIRKRFTGSTRILGGLITHLKFNRDWRKLQSEWGKIAPYLKVFMNGMYFPFNEELVETIQELIEENYMEALLVDASFREVLRRFEEVPHEKILKAIREELSAVE